MFALRIQDTKFEIPYVCNFEIPNLERILGIMSKFIEVRYLRKEFNNNSKISKFLYFLETPKEIRVRYSLCNLCKYTCRCCSQNFLHV